MKRILSKMLVFLLGVALTLPSFVYGDQGQIPKRLLNPLKVDSIEKFLELILRIVTIFAVPIIIFFIIYAGFLFVTAQGNEAKITKAKNALLWSIIGGVIILGAHVLLAIVTKTVESLKAP